MLSRRHIFPLAGLAAVGLTDAALAVAPKSTEHGAALQVSLRVVYGQWEVCVPVRTRKWVPGYAIEIEWMPLADFLKEIEKECGIVRLSDAPSDV